MRNRLIPDHYIGSRHLTNWFIKNLGMISLSHIFVNGEEFYRDELTSLEVNIYELGTIYLVFDDGRTIKFSCDNLKMEKQYA